MDMSVNFGSSAGIRRCIKNYKPLSIVPMFANNNTRYFIFDRESKLFGAFNFSADGVLSNVRFDQTVKNKRTAVDAILSMKDFIFKRAKDNGADFVDFSILVKEKNVKKLVGLFSKFDVAEAGFIDGALKFVGILNPQKELEIMSSIGKKSADKAANKAANKASDSLRAVHVLIDA